MTEAELAAAFEAQKPILAAWGGKVASSIIHKLQEQLGGPEAVEAFLRIPVRPRVKETKSFLAKALRRAKGYTRPLEEITDKVGVRFVVLLTSETKHITEIIEKSNLWEAQKARGFEAERLERPHYFDYQSDHYIVRPVRPIPLNELTVPAGTPCEVQVRTLLQHAYAELSHETTYKPSVAIEPDVSRQIAKSAALVETTDDIFLRAKQAVDNASKKLLTTCEVAAKAYTGLVGQPGENDLRLGCFLLDLYRGFLDELTEDNLRTFLKERQFIAAKIQERAPLSRLYRSPCVLVIYYLVQNHPDDVPPKWPVDQHYLHPIYLDLGISTESRL